MQDPSPLRHDDLYHTGFVVEDLSAAKAHVARLLGVSWLEGGGTVLMSGPDGESSVVTKYAVSAEGPHHVELVQAVPGTLYSVTGPQRAHHLGYWVDDVQAVSTELASAGWPLAASVSFEGSRRGPITAYHRTPDGFYVEVVARSMKRILFPDGATR